MSLRVDEGKSVILSHEAWAIMSLPGDSGSQASP